jgi:hypothetical protein
MQPLCFQITSLLNKSSVVNVCPASLSFRPSNLLLSTTKQTEHAELDASTFNGIYCICLFNKYFDYIIVQIYKGFPQESDINIFGWNW